MSDTELLIKNFIIRLTYIESDFNKDIVTNPDDSSNDVKLLDAMKIMLSKFRVSFLGGIEYLSEILRDRIVENMQIKQIICEVYRGIFDDKLLSKDYDKIKNRLLELQQKLLDFNIIINTIKPTTALLPITKSPKASITFPAYP